MKRNIPVIILATLYIVLIILSFYSNTSHLNTRRKQDRIIATQQDVNYKQQQVIALLEEQIKDEQAVSNVLYDICELHGLLQEVE